MVPDGPRTRERIAPWGKVFTMTTAFVTGGSGFVGGKLISRLIADGHEVRALARSDRAAERVAELGATPQRGDITDPSSLTKAAEGAELAFHAAAWLDRTGSWADFVKSNVDGTRNVIEACRTAGVRRLVHVSTEAVLIAGDPLINVDETAPLRPDSRAPYPATKARAERLVREASDLETVIVRPRFVWGAGDTSVLPNIVAAVKSGRFAWIGGGTHLTDTTHIDNTVEGLILAAQRGKPGEAYFVTDGDRVQFRAFLSELFETQGVQPPSRSLPYWLARTIAEVGERGTRLLGRGAPPLDYFALWVSGLECTINIDKARDQLGYVPVRTREEGLAELRRGAAS
jgi:nucleoside-diphosphate-sugar epimerase